MNKPHIKLLPKDERFLQIDWTCVYITVGGIYCGYGRTPLEAYRDYSPEDEFDIFDMVEACEEGEE